MPDAAALPRLTLRILVTGGSGVLGRATIPVLRSAGHRVSAPASSALDLLDPAALGPAVAAVDAVLHLATRIPAPADMERPVALAAPSGIYNVCRDGERVSNERFKRVTPWRPER